MKRCWKRPKLDKYMRITASVARSDAGNDQNERNARGLQHGSHEAMPEMTKMSKPHENSTHRSHEAMLEITKMRKNSIEEYSVGHIKAMLEITKWVKQTRITASVARSDAGHDHNEQNPRELHPSVTLSDAGNDRKDVKLNENYSIGHMKRCYNFTKMSRKHENHPTIGQEMSNSSILSRWCARKKKIGEKNTQDIIENAPSPRITRIMGYVRS